MSSKPSELWGAAEAYEQYMGRWSRRIAPLFIDWLGAPIGKRWADIGCGTGQLSFQIAKSCEPKHLVGIDTSADFIAHAAKYVPTAEFRQSDAASIDIPSKGFDYAVSGLLLNFASDKAKVLSEMARIVRPGGMVALYVWDYAGQMQIMRYFFDVARAIDPKSAAYDDGINAPICRPNALSQAFAAAGRCDVETTAIDITAAFAGFQDYWQPFLGGTGSAPRYCMSLDEDTRNRIRNTVQAKLPTGPEGEILLALRAWAVKGGVPV